MKIGLLADIHGNVHALKAVLKSAKKQGADKLLCCGDYVGYYYDPDSVMALLDNWDWVGISGNHEAMLYDWLNNNNREEIKAKYGSGISIASKKLDYETAVRLYEMPSQTKLNIKNYKVMLCHGSPWERDNYIYPDAKQQTVDKMFTYNPDFNVLVYGHTHYPAVWKHKNQIIINPGSVGQTRDYKPGASWALWDTVTNDVIFYKEKYDVNPVIEMCQTYDPDIKYLANVLVRK